MSHDRERAVSGHASDDVRPAAGAWPGRRTLAGTSGAGGGGGGDGPQAAAGSGGIRLPEGLRAQMESSFQADFSDVSVHSGGRASELGAEAVAFGAELHFAPGRFDPDSSAGRELIGHELAHVVQQRQGRAAGAQGRGGEVHDAGLEAEADLLGARAARGEVVAGGPAPAPGSGARAAQCKRMLGLEFQAQWPLEQKNGGSWEPATRGLPLFKDSTGLLGSNPTSSSRAADEPFNFAIEPDDHETEFITPPFEDKPTLERAMDLMHRMTNALRGALAANGNIATMAQVSEAYRASVRTLPHPTRVGAPLVPKTKTIPSPGNYRFNDSRAPSDKTARPQATFSAGLAEYNSAASAFQVDKQVGVGDEHSASARVFAGALERARRITAALDASKDWRQLTSFLSLVIGYLWEPQAFVGQGGVSYSKGSFGVMLRNDFHSLYRQLADYEQAQFTPDWVLGVTGMDGAAPVMGYGFKIEATQEVQFGPSRRDWLTSIKTPAAFAVDAEDRRYADLNVRDEDHIVERRGKPEVDREAVSAAKAAQLAQLGGRDLMSRGGVHASSASLGEYGDKGKQVITEWRGMRPTGMARAAWKGAGSELFDRLQGAGPAAVPTPYRLARRQQKIAATGWGVANLVDAASRATVLKPAFMRSAYRDGAGQTWRLIDAVSPLAAGKHALAEDPAKRAALNAALVYTMEEVFAEDAAEMLPAYAGHLTPRPVPAPMPVDKPRSDEPRDPPPPDDRHPPPGDRGPDGGPAPPAHHGGSGEKAPPPSGHDPGGHHTSTLGSGMPLPAWLEELFSVPPPDRPGMSSSSTVSHPPTLPLPSWNASLPVAVGLASSSSSSSAFAPQPQPQPQPISLAPAQPGTSKKMRRLDEVTAVRQATQRFAVGDLGVVFGPVQAHQIFQQRTLEPARWPVVFGLTGQAYAFKGCTSNGLFEFELR